MKENNTNIQHALNGGEYRINSLGYWLDGYDSINNIAYEVDEPGHYKNGKLKDADIRRQKEIEKLLNCDVIRLKLEDVKNKVIWYKNKQV